MKLSLVRESSIAVLTKIMNVKIGKYAIGQIPFFQEENFSFFDDSKNGPTLITLLPINHRIDFRGDSEY